MLKKFKNRVGRGFIDSIGSRPNRLLEEPLRSELFSVDQMQSHSKILAASHEIVKSHFPRDKLLSRLVENEAVLIQTRVVLNEAATAKRRILPAADWLLDNFYLIEEHIGISKRDLPKGYSRGLPRLGKGKSMGLPRVYDIALERISHGDGLVDPETLSGYLDSYQSVSVLTLGELWAIPIMLRLALIENLRRVALQITSEVQAQSEADAWADKMTASLEKDPKSLILIIADMAKSDPPMVNSFVAELARKLQGKGPELSLPLTWIEQRLSEVGLTIEQLVQSAMRQQAADQVSISNSIRGLRSLSSMDWKKLVESTSIVEQILRSDPSGYYSKMDFTTRDRYRHKIEKIANKGDLPEEAVASQAIQLARKAQEQDGKDDRHAHVGYYLIDKGIAPLLKSLHVKASIKEKASVNGFKSTLALYLGSIGVLTGLTTMVLIMLAYGGGASIPSLWILVVPLLIGTIGFSVAVVNFIGTTFTEPHLLPRMDYSAGVPSKSRTLVVVPSMLASENHVELLVDALEVRFLANRDSNVSFGLLTDYQDSEYQTNPDDGALLKQVERRIHMLNEQYGGRQGNPFCLFHRPRRWNAVARTWMGYERKRGKLAALNDLLRGGNEDDFELIIGNLKMLKSVKYVITLDTDTQLPRECARRLAGIMAHPLNQVKYDKNDNRIVEGYCIIQPRVAISLQGAQQSLYAKLNNSDPGLDPYSRAVSDLYQDLFGEGSFTGKGIYDVDCFERSLKGKFPENRILSHDLLEGCYARSGLASDIQLYEESPAAYADDVERHKRWVRGDWQIARWLCKTVPTLNKGVDINPLSTLSKWKIFDNLRRSLQSAAITVLLIFGWIDISRPLAWTIGIGSLIFVPALITSSVDLISILRNSRFLDKLGEVARSTMVRLVNGLLILTCLPYEAWVCIKTILQTIWRLLVARRQLLAWKPSGTHGGKDQAGFWASLRIMWVGPVIAVATWIVLFFLRPSVVLISLPFTVFWLVSPVIIWSISRKKAAKVAAINSSQYEYLGSLARKTWSFFETFVNEEENWLPPDNFQEIPAAKIAHRTSPTNIGLSLLANLTAYDLGYLSSGKLLYRTTHTLDSVMQLERYKNHLYNWYDTLTLKPLLPRYVSTVDSGNLTAHLLTLGVGIGSLGEGRLLNDRFWEGLSDTERILASIKNDESDELLVEIQQEIKTVMLARPDSLVDSYAVLKQVYSTAEIIRDSLRYGADVPLALWSNAFALQLRDALEELDFLAPWLCKEIDLGIAIGVNAIDANPNLKELYSFEIEWMKASEDSTPKQAADSKNTSHAELKQLVREGIQNAEARFAKIDQIMSDLNQLGQSNYAFLYSKRRHLLTIGYDVEGRRSDSGHYDLLASEARLASFIAIAQEEIPQDNWFALGRLLVANKGKSLLFSWSGSMFEYLMPLLVMPAYDQTLLGQSCVAAVESQIDYGRLRGIPWGISESGYNSFDLGINYRYKAFGVPGLGLKRGLINDLVIAPYASALALMVLPEKACINLQRLSAEGFEGDYGLYEAIDYTKTRVPSGQAYAIVRSFMAHHQAMSFISIASLILERPMQKRFQSIPQARATLLLLEEKVPHANRNNAQEPDIPEIHVAVENLRTSARVFKDPNSINPAVHILSNGRYHSMVNASGSGYNRWNGLSVTRWTEDCTADNKGSFLFIHDIQSGEFWSNTYQPTLKKPDQYEAIFSEARAEFRRHDGDLVTYTEISVSPEDDIELRRIRIENRSKIPKTIEITSYAEVVLATSHSDAAHPSFSNLFIQTRILEEKQAILCTRRPRSQNDLVPWMFQLMNVRDATVLEVSYDTDRSIFLGRGNTIVSPKAMVNSGPLSGSSGSVLDPIVAIRQRIIITPVCTATIDIITGISSSKEASTSLIDRYQDKCFANRTFELARTHSQVILQQINGSEADARLYSQLAASILYANAALRAESSVIKANQRGQSALWGHSISGDIPIVLLKIKDASNIDLIRQLVQAHTYWRQKGLAVDLIIWNEERGGYQQQLQNQILGLITADNHVSIIDRSGGIFVRSADQISAEDRILIQAVAHVIISDKLGSLEEQVEGRLKGKVNVPKLISTKALKKYPELKTNGQQELQFPNGYGGFSPDGTEYIINQQQGLVTPAPWINILANHSFGTVVSEAGMAYTWSENAHEFRLTPWYNDPVCDTSGEAIYIRDEETGHFWSVTPLPRRGQTPYVCRHGFGYSTFEHSEQGIETELCIFVAKDEPVKFSSLKVVNKSGRSRRLSATSYVQLVLGELPSKSAMHIVTEIEKETGALFARNKYSTEFSSRVVFFDVSDDDFSYTGDRAEFIGQNRNLENPEAMSRMNLSGRVGAALDPCGAIQIPFTLGRGSSRTIVFRFGSGRDTDEALGLVKKFRVSGTAVVALRDIKTFWEETLGAVHVDTPDAALDVLANGWLIYQVLSSRLWGRTGYYQSGGAFGFRDQLQDAMSLVHVKPELLRSQILLSASRQFPEGDVQHWWHPPVGRGVRTHCSDDYLWLAMATCRYIESTGDGNILDVEVPYIEGNQIADGEESYYDLPESSSIRSTLYEHCVRAIQYGSRRGAHGLPLIGSGDWNDGMNKVGEKGLGESVWLAFFLYDILKQFCKIAGSHDDAPFADYCVLEAAKLELAIESQAWDGSWYRRAYFDNGKPLGSAGNAECRIDSISQSWAVISGAGKQDRASQAMDSVYKKLARPAEGLIQLLDPPFDVELPTPGYIQAYVPGVRENGGQYTHAAIWTIMAFVKMGDCKRAWELFAMINPVNHASTLEAASKYMVEPYVVAADVYSVSPHTGRGGWTWYTGSASWMYRLIIENLLGVKLYIDRLHIAPCLPDSWTGFKIRYQYKTTVYKIQVTINDAVLEAESPLILLDGLLQGDTMIPLVDDHVEHQVEVMIRKKESKGESS